MRINIGNPQNMGTGNQHMPAGMIAGRAVNFDKLAMVPREQAARIANLALFPIQQEEHPEEMVLGVAVLFAALTLRTGKDPHDLFEMAKRVILQPLDGTHKEADTQIQVLRDWVGLKVLAKEATIG